MRKGPSFLVQGLAAESSLGPFYGKCVWCDLHLMHMSEACMQRKVSQQEPSARACRYVRNTTARAFSVVASALGIPALLPFLKAVCQSKKSWQARHTGIKIVQQIAILLGCAVLPHLKARLRALSAQCVTPLGKRFSEVMHGRHMSCIASSSCYVWAG